MLSFMATIFIFFSLPLIAYGKEGVGKIEPKKEALGAPKGAIIYYDQLKSMPGYFKTREALMTPLLETFLQGSLLLTLSENNIYPLYAAPFGSNVSPPQEVIAPPNCWYHIYETEKKLKDCFPDDHTRLDAVFTDRNLKNFRVALIITDGVQPIERFKKGEMARINNKSTLKCIEGSDLGCVKRAIKPLIEDGFGIWLIGVLTQFDGNIYPEIPNLQGEKKSFDYNGLRPAYIFILSKDVELGRDTTIILSEALERVRSRFKKEELKVKSLELTPIVRTKFTPNLLRELPGNTETTILLDRPRVSKNRTFEQDGKCIGNKVVEYPISISALAPSSPFIPQAVSWMPRLVMDDWQQGWVNLSRRGWNPQKKVWEWTIGIDCGRMPSRIQDSKVYITIYPEPSLATDVSAAKEWWYEWSTNDDSTKDNASKTLNLHKLVSFISTEASASSQKDSTIIFQFFR